MSSRGPFRHALEYMFAVVIKTLKGNHLVGMSFLLKFVKGRSGYKAKAKYNYGRCSKIASTAEGSLALAEARKVFFPFGVGLTAPWCHFSALFPLT